MNRWPETDQTWTMTLEQLIAFYLECTGDQGGNLHVTLADGNCADNDLVFCYQVTMDKNDFLGNLICNMLQNIPQHHRQCAIYRAKELMK